MILSESNFQHHSHTILGILMKYTHTYTQDSLIYDTKQLQEIH